MNRVVSSARYLALAGVVFGLVAALAAFGWGGVKTVLIVVKLAHGELDGMAVALVGVFDALLIAAGLLIFALGMYEVFVGELELPEWLVFRDFDTLKGKLVGIVVMVLAVTFLERLESGSDGRDILQAGAGAAMVAAVLVWMAKKS